MKLSALFAIASAGFVSITLALPTQPDVEVKELKPVSESQDTTLTLKASDAARVKAGGASVAAANLGLLVTLCRDRDFSGCWDAWGDTGKCHNLGSGSNDVISSIRNPKGIFNTYNCWFYEHSNCSGAEYYVAGGRQSSFVGSDWNDKISSFWCAHAA